MSQERMKILEQLSSGAINAAQAAEMLNALKSGSDEPIVEEVVADEPAVADEAAVEEPTVKALKVEVQVEEEEADEDAGEDPIEKVEIEDETPEPVSEEPTTGKRLHIHVFDKNSDKHRVKISIPYGLLKFGMSIGERFAPSIKGFNWDDFAIDVDEEGERVKIFVG